MFPLLFWKMRAAVMSMTPTEAYGLLEVLVADWQSRSVLVNISCFCI